MPKVKKSPPVTKPSGRKAYVKDDVHLVTLKRQLTISPKTAHMLILAGHSDYRSLQNVSTNTLLAQLATYPGMDKKLCESYRRAARRIVWCGSVDNPEAVEKNCHKWTNKMFKDKEIWVDDFDDLTGLELDQRFGQTLREMSMKSS